MAVAFSVLLLLLGGATLFAAYLSLREQSRQIAAQQAVLEQRQRELDQQAADLKAQTDELARRVQLPSETPAPPPQVSPTPQASAPVVFLTLSAGVTRSVGGSRTARLRPETSEVQLTLDLRDTSYPSYRATIINADRGEVFSRDGLRQQAARLTLRVPAKQLPPGDYYVSVYGGSANESVADYPFRIIK
jgi:DNA-binding transcriptional MerR regulator